MKIRNCFPLKVIYIVALFAIIGIALFLRVYFPYEHVFVDSRVIFKMTDCWYHMRLVENLLHHFPYLISFDPYSIFPTGQNVAFAPFFDLLLGFVIWIAGLGNPTKHTMEIVAAYFPATMGALTTIVVYFIGKEVFNRNVGLLSAALIAILPGQFLFRSLLGYTDHHVAEVFFSTMTMLFLIMAVKTAKENDITFSHIWKGDWKNVRKLLSYIFLTGLFLGIYIISWIGSPLFILIIFIYIIIQYIVEHLRGKSTDYLCIIGFPSFLTALIITVPFLHHGRLEAMHLVSLAVGILTFSVLNGVSKLMATKNIRRVYYPLVLIGLTLVGLLGFHIVAPSLLSSMLSRFSIFMPSGSALTISEVKPLLFFHGAFSLKLTWQFFTTTFFIAIISLGLVIYTVIKKANAEKILFLTWSVVMLLATLGQNRFAYYFAVNVALLSGYFCWRMPGWISEILKQNGSGALSLTNKNTKEGKKAKSEKRWDRKRKKPRSFIPEYLRRRYVVIAITVILVFFVVFYPNIRMAISSASFPSGPNRDWYNSLIWMRENTPDPFQNPDFYYELYKKPSAGKGYSYPESAYGVMSWWDYGHWITYIAHRIPNSNPHQTGAGGVARFFISQDENSASKILNKLGSKYVIIDNKMAMEEKFYAMAIFAGKNWSQFFGVYYQKADGKVKPVMLYYPEYYRSMCSRLYNFEGNAVIPVNSTGVISYIERINKKGTKYKKISDYKLFPTYKEAKTFLKTHPDYRIVGTNPFISPVPLEKLKHYRLIHKSDSSVTKQRGKKNSCVKIFEYIP